MKTNSCRLGLIGALVLLAMALPHLLYAQVNSWTNAPGGKWETGANWSLGVPPASSQSAFVTNAASKTVTIDATTTNAASTMTVSNLTVFAPTAGVTNTVALANAGLGVPLHVVNTLIISTGGALTITNSALFVEGKGAAGLAINGGANVSFMDGSLVSTSNPTAGNLVLGFSTGNRGQMTVAGGSLSVGLCLLGKFVGAQGTLTISGGTNIISTLSVGENAANTTGTVWMTGGLLTANFGTSVRIGGGGVGQMVLSNGSVQAFGVLVRGPSSTLTMAGGAFQAASSFQIAPSLNTTGSVWLTGGQLTVTNGTTSVASTSSGAGQMTVSNGTYLARDVSVASAGTGSLTIAGGTSSVFSNMTLGNFACTATGIVNVGGGNLFVTNAAGNATLEVRSGTLTLSSGTLGVDIFVLTNSCARFIRNGGALTYRQLVFNPALSTVGDGIPDAWRAVFFGGDGSTTNSSSCAACDPDGDGQNNLAEFQSGTDPTSSASFLGITSISQLSTNILVTWTMGSGKTNALQRSITLSELTFAPIFTVTNTVGTTTNYLDVGAATNVPAFYYRVRLVP